VDSSEAQSGKAMEALHAENERLQALLAEKQAKQERLRGEVKVRAAGLTLRPRDELASFFFFFLV
jgi:hypothetical protein